jgi:hypothetical protein
MAELPLGGPRHWLEFPDPEDISRDPAVVYRMDLTWLTSRWTCIFGSGCPGIYADRPDDGCCSLGAHYADEQDRLRVEGLARELGGDEWQFREVGLSDGVSELDGEGEAKTRVIEGACVFLNRPGFAGGAGCVLHRLALERGLPLTSTKPEVCWQLPIRRSYAEATRPDGTAYTVVEIAEYDRRGWGEGGHDLDWYCTTAVEAHVGAQPVYLSCRAELVELVGQPAYDVMAEHCRARERALLALALGSRPPAGLAPHPAGGQPASPDQAGPAGPAADPVVETGAGLPPEGCTG